MGENIFKDSAVASHAHDLLGIIWHLDLWLQNEHERLSEMKRSNQHSLCLEDNVDKEELRMKRLREMRREAVEAFIDIGGNSDG